MCSGICAGYAYYATQYGYEVRLWAQPCVRFQRRPERVVWGFWRANTLYLSSSSVKIRGS